MVHWTRLRKMREGSWNVKIDTWNGWREIDLWWWGAQRKNLFLDTLTPTLKSAHTCICSCDYIYMKTHLKFQLLSCKHPKWLQQSLYTVLMTKIISHKRCIRRPPSCTAAETYKTIVACKEHFFPTTPEAKFTMSKVEHVVVVVLILCVELEAHKASRN